MRTPVAIVLGALVGVGIAGAIARVSGGTTDETPSQDSLTLATTPVMQQTIVLTDETIATLEFVDAAIVNAPTTGTITSTVEDGSTIVAGTVVATIDSSPVIALYGDVPAYRDLDASSTSGIDIYQLETNLVALGFDPDGDIEIDRDFDSATSNAVERWQASLGIEEDGSVPQGLIVYVPGTILVDGAPAAVGTGVQEGAQLASGRVLERVLTVPSTVDDRGAIDRGAIDRIAVPGAAVVTGSLLFVDGSTPVVAIEGDMAASPALERDLSTTSADGADVKLLETMLDTLGFDADGSLVIDDEFDVATSQAVNAWHSSLGVLGEDADPDAMVVAAGSFVVVPGGLVVGDAVVSSGTTLAGEGPVLELTSPSRVVSTTAPIGDSTFELGAIIEIEYPDGTTTEGIVTKLGTTATNASGQPGGTVTVAVSITPTQVPDSVLGFVQVPVTLRVVTETIPDAFVVPSSALVALAEGGYALEVAESDGSTRLIGVDTGTFQSGFVEVTGDGLSTDLTVVVPS